MNTQFSRTLRTLGFSIVSTVLTGFLSAHASGNNSAPTMDRAYAGDGNHKPSKKGSASTAEVSYVGTLDDNPLFHVVYNNSTGARFSIRIFDADGHQLYQGVFSDRKFDKKFKIETTGLSGRLVFAVRNFQDNSEQNFQVEASTRMVEDVEVREVK